LSFFGLNVLRLIAGNRIDEDTCELLRCPVCHASLKLSGETFECVNPECPAQFPVVDGIPVLINEQSSLFSIQDFVSHRSTFFNNNESFLKKTAKRLMPNISLNVKGKSNYRKFVRHLLDRSQSPRVLVIGGSIAGQGMEPLMENPAITLVESDVSFGARTTLICDAHDIPFEDAAFDGVIVQAVMEHVVDPYRCCDEIRRVLKTDGVVYAETPFMQQVHGGRYDFTRFTHLGHRRLFRGFDELDSGPVCGPAMALAWSYQHFLMSFTSSAVLKEVLQCFARITSCCLKYFDYYLINKPGAYDAASGFFFMGKKTERALSDRELINLYRGAKSSGQSTDDRSCMIAMD